MQKEHKLNKLISATSTPNGIKFYSKLHKNTLIISQVKNNEIEATCIGKKTELNLYDNVPSFIIRIFAVLSLILLLVLAYFAYSILYTRNINSIRICLILMSFIRFLRFFVNEYLHGKYTETLKFHCAEHMTINAYLKQTRIPTLNEIKTASRYSNNCGVNDIAVKAFTPIITFLCTFIPLFKASLISYLIIELICTLISTCGGFKFMQYFATKPPDDIHIYVALEGIKLWDKQNRNDSDSL